MSREYRERKRRFGVSLPESLASQLDELGEKLSTDRSRLVEEAVRMFIRDHRHYLYPHECKGILIIQFASDPHVISEIKKIVESHKDITKFSVHFHVNNDCLEIIAVSGSSNKIASLHMDIQGLKKANTRYIPLARLE